MENFGNAGERAQTNLKFQPQINTDEYKCSMFNVQCSMFNYGNVGDRAQTNLKFQPQINTDKH